MARIRSVVARGGGASLAGVRLRPALSSVRVGVDDPVRRLPGGALVPLPALRTDWRTSVCGLLRLRALNITNQAVQVAERLVEPPSKVFQLTDPLSTIGQQLVDPLQDDGAAHAPASTALDLLGLLIRQHWLVDEDKAKLIQHLDGVKRLRSIRRVCRSSGRRTATWRFDVRSRRGDPRLNRRSREGTSAQRTTRDVAVGEGPLGGRAVGGRGG